jgi:photosystem II stability/assembly factor-like uncharacterized protein
MKKIKIILLIISVALISGCAISFKTKTVSVNDLGIYKTDNKGDRWAQRVLLSNTNPNPKNIGWISVNSLAMDPNDSKAVYWGSSENGLFYTYDGSGGWQLAAGLGQKTIRDVVVDPKSKCVIYANIDNSVYKSTDCNRNWSRIYYDNSEKTMINAIAVDHYDNNNVYIGTSRGEVIKSVDAGASWQTVARLEGNVVKIVINPPDSRIIFAATSEKWLNRSLDSGKTWQNLKENLKDFKESAAFKDLVIPKASSSAVFLATNYGLLKSTDNGDSWTKIELITSEKKGVINTLAVNPKDADEIYYVTNTTFYHSSDGGKNWATKKLPTSGAGWKLAVDFNDPNIIYLGVKNIEK